MPRSVAQKLPEVALNTKSHRILAVEDEQHMMDTFTMLLDRTYSLSAAPTAQEALRELARGKFDLILLDLMLPDMDGMDLLRTVKRDHPDAIVIVVTGRREVRTVVEAMKLGAYDYIEKPFDRDQFILTVQRAVEKASLEKELQSLRTEIAQTWGLHGIVGKSPRMLEVLDLLERVKGSDANVLFTGESGTGKELFARAAHYLGIRSKGPFVTMNCARYDAHLLESELFGHEQGAFTGATRRRKGKLELADGGTLFLDEIGNMSPDMQAKILRVVEDRVFEPLGAEKSLSVDIRLISATNTDLAKAMDSGGFRSDLYYRLDVIRVHLPPLRERREDIPLLIEHFLAEFADRMGRPPAKLTAQAEQYLQSLEWRGNVRELRNVIERALALSDKHELGEECFRSGPAKAAESPGDCGETVLQSFSRKAAKDVLIEALRKNDWNQVHTARELGCHRNTVMRLMKRFGITPDAS